MSEAAEFIADLDEELRDSGQDVVLRRIGEDGEPIEHTCRAIVRGYRLDELQGGIEQGDTALIVSPTGLSADFADTDDTRLRSNDRIEFDGRECNVQIVDPVRIAGTLVRMNVTVRG